MNMISTGAFQEEMDASTKTETLAEKFARVWEKKNSKVARAGGVSLMALSLAACGSDDEEAADPVVAEPVVVVPDGVDQALTANEDTFVGVAGGDDTFTGTSATMTADDNIVDTSSTDNDTLNVTLSAAAPVMDVSGIENVNINWDSLLVPTVDLDDVAGATVTLSTARSGHNGDANVDNAGSNAIVFGAGFDDQVTVDGLDGGSVSSSAADSVDVGTGTAADGTVSVTADVATTVNVTGGDDVTVSAVAADTITIDGGDAEAVSLTVGVDAALTLTGNANTSATITSGAADAVTMTIAGGGWTSSTTAISGTVNLTGVNADLTGETITGANTVTISDELDTMDISSIGAAGFVFETVDADGAVVLDVASGQTLTFEADASGTAGLTVQTSAADDAAADTLNMTLEVATAQEIDVAGGTGDIETLNLTVDAVATTTALTIDDIAAGTGTVNLISSRADLDLTINNGAGNGITAGTFDASAVAGELTATQVADAVMSMVGAADATTMTFGGTTVESTFESTNAANDSVTFGTTTGAATAVFAGGDNTVLANAVTTGTVSVTAGAGDDVLEVNAITSGHATAALGDGDNTVRVGDGGAMAANGTVTVSTGTGDNTLVIEDNGVASFSITMDFGTGTGTLDISEGTIDITDGTFSLTGMDVIAIGSSTTAALVDATLLDGVTVEIQGDGTATDQLTVVMEAAAAVTNDFSNVTMSNDAATDVGGLAITGSANNDTVIATAGGDSFDGSANADYTLTMGAGADSITMGTGEVTVIVASGDSGTTAATVDTLAGFTSGTDTISTGVAGTFANYVETDMASGGADQTVATALAAADAVFDGTIQFQLVVDSGETDAGGIDLATDALLFIDWDLDGSADAAIQLTATTAAGFAGSDIIA